LKYDTDTYDEDKVMGEITDDLSNSNSRDKKKASPDMVEVKGS
jgi:hypothetical protein